MKHHRAPVLIPGWPRVGRWGFSHSLDHWKQPDRNLPPPPGGEWGFVPQPLGPMSPAPPWRQSNASLALSPSFFSLGFLSVPGGPRTSAWPAEGTQKTGVTNGGSLCWGSSRGQGRPPNTVLDTLLGSVVRGMLSLIFIFWKKKRSPSLYKCWLTPTRPSADSPSPSTVPG
jgi:hypothetical protein